MVGGKPESIGSSNAGLPKGKAGIGQDQKEKGKINENTNIKTTTTTLY